LSTRSAETRRKIVEAATQMVIERGYAETTMRAIAQSAGVSVGSAYYYFSGKEELIQGIYEQIAEETIAEARRRMKNEPAFGARLQHTVQSYLDVSDRYRSIADTLLSLAIVPSSSLSPFSPESAPVRDKITALYKEVVEDSDLATDKRLIPELPQALWLMHMGVTLAWVHDRTEGQRTTRAIVARSLPALDRLLRLVRVPVLRPFVKEAISILRILDGRDKA